MLPAARRAMRWRPDSAATRGRGRPKTAGHAVPPAHAVSPPASAPPPPPPPAPPAPATSTISIT
eukprot:7440402-Pyramimonas_sp.AAC.2